jgi:hypothetical protein
VTTVDRQRWIAGRIRFLEEELGKGVPDAERSVIESEVEALRKEAGPRRWLRRLLGLPGSPTGR